MKTAFRIVLIILFALVAGIIINQVQPGGISWRSLLYPTLYKSGLLNSDFMVVSADSAIALLNSGSAVFIDVRTEEDYRLDHISGAENIPSGIIIKGRFLTPGNYNNKTVILLYDEEGDLEQLELLSAIWSSHGVKKIYILFGGYLSWLQNQYPVDFDG